MPEQTFIKVTKNDWKTRDFMKVKDKEIKKDYLTF